MKKLTTLGLTVATSGVMALGAVGISSAATTTAAIPRSAIRQAHLQAETEVLGVSSDTIKADHKAHTFSQLLTAKQLTKESYHQKLKDQLKKDLELKGYSDEQITAALQHHGHGRMHHKRHMQ